MPDREKVIKGLECCANDKPFYHAHCDECLYNGRKPDNMGGCTKLYRDALELLKKQAELVRCKDCKHAADFCDLYYVGIHRCEKHCWFREANWFCADGERR